MDVTILAMGLGGSESLEAAKIFGGNMKYNPDEECEKLMKNIRTLCELKSMSQHAVAVKADISSSTIHCLMTGKTKPYVHTLFKLCNTLDVSVEDILNMDSQISRINAELTDDEREVLLG